MSDWYDKHIPDEELAKYVRELEDEIERLRRLREWDERPETLPGGLVMEHARLDLMWQKLVKENRVLRSQLTAAEAVVEAARELEELVHDSPHGVCRLSILVDADRKLGEALRAYDAAKGGE